MILGIGAAMIRTGWGAMMRGAGMMGGGGTLGLTMIRTGRGATMIRTGAGAPASIGGAGAGASIIGMFGAASFVASFVTLASLGFAGA